MVSNGLSLGGLTGENRKGNCRKMLHAIEHLNVRGEMRCNRSNA